MLFLLTYDRSSGRLIDLKRFNDAERVRALEERFARELQERSRPEREIVLLSADSETDLRTTHARYFNSLTELLSDFGPQLRHS